MNIVIAINIKLMVSSLLHSVTQKEWHSLLCAFNFEMEHIHYKSKNNEYCVHSALKNAETKPRLKFLSQKTSHIPAEYLHCLMVWIWRTYKYIKHLFGICALVQIICPNFIERGILLLCGQVLAPKFRPIWCARGRKHEREREKCKNCEQRVQVFTALADAVISSFIVISEIRGTNLSLMSQNKITSFRVSRNGVFCRVGFKLYHFLDVTTQCVGISFHVLHTGAIYLQCLGMLFLAFVMSLKNAFS